MSIRALVLLLTVFLYSSLTFATVDEVLFSIHGSNTVGAKLAAECAKSYLQSLGLQKVSIDQDVKENEYLINGIQGRGLAMRRVAIKIAAHGSSTGFSGLEQGLASMAMSSRAIKSSEVQRLQRFGDMRSRQAEHTIAIDGLAILVHPSNPINELTVQQLAKVFSGEIKDWQQLGQPQAAINLYARDEKSGTWDTFKNLVLKKYSMSLHKSAKRFESNDLLSDSVSADINAIGFSGLASVRSAKLLAISDNNTAPMLPSHFSVATEDYPLSRRLYFYTSAEKQSPWVNDYVNYCLSEAGQALVEDVGFISQNIQVYQPKMNEFAPIKYQQLSKHALRLSVNFRFSQGSPRLDNKAYRDIYRLLDFLSKPENESMRVYLVGFSDDNESFNQDVLSRFRALAVRGALLREGVIVADSFGLGSFLPVASNADDGSKLKNARVEVWVARAEITEAISSR